MVIVSQKHVQAADQIIQRRILRLQADRLLVLGDGVLELTELEVETSQPHACDVVIAIERDGRLERRNGLVWFLRTLIHRCHGAVDSVQRVLELSRVAQQVPVPR